MLVLTSPRTHRRPQWPFGINWASRQAEGLEVWVPFVNGYGVVLTKGGSLGRPTVSTPKFRADGLGDYGIDFNGTDGNAADFPYPDAPLITSAGITIVWTGIVDTTSDYRHFAGKHEFGGGTNNPFEFRTGPGTTQLVLVRANAGGHQEMVGSSLTAGKYHTLAVRVSDNLIQTLPDFFVDGTKTAGTAGASSGTPTGAVTGTSQNIRIGNRTAGSAIQMDGLCAEMRFYNRAISDAAIQEISDGRTRWDLYWQPTKTFLVAVGGGGGGGSAFPALSVAI
jgi:hypothetical protein